MKTDWLRASLAAVLGLALAGAALAQKTQLTVYTALETDQLKAYESGFTKVNPNIELKWVRDSTGVITAKLLAEKTNPQADVVMGVAASSLALLDSQGMLIPYAPLNLDAIMSQYRDKKSPPAWFGMDVWGATVCFNTVEAQKKNLPKPETWKDLTKPIYKGQIVMPNPASSGTGYFDVTAWLHALGRRQRQGRRLEVHGRAAREHRAVHPFRLQALQHGRHRRVRDGHLVRVPREHQQGQGRADRPGVPEGRPGLGPRGVRDPQGHEEDGGGARSWPTGPSSKDAMLLYGKNFAITAQPGVAEPLPNVPADYEKRLVKMDFKFAADEPRAHPGRVDEALRRQIRAEEVGDWAPPGRVERPRPRRIGRPTCLA